MRLKLGIIALFVSTFIGCSSNDVVNSEQTVEEKKAVLYYDQGSNDLIAQNYQQALTNLLKAKELAPNDTKVRNNLGMAYYFREQIPLAIQELKEAISLDSKNTDAKMNLATVYMNLGKIDEAKKNFQDTLKDLTFSSLYRVHYNLAILNLKIGDRKSAYEELFLALKEKEDYCLAHYKLGELYTEEYHFKEAHKSFVESTKGSCVTKPETHYGVAMALINLNRTMEAKTKLQEIINKFPKSNFKTLAEKKIRNLSDDSREEKADLNTNLNTETPVTESPKF
jgi:Tfp pilus assembly protein PilF